MWKSMKLEHANGRSSPPPDPLPTTVDRLVVIPHIGAGGAQRVATLLLNRWQRSGLRCAVITLFPAQDAYELDPGIWREDFIPGNEPSAARDPLARMYFRLEDSLETEASAGHRLKQVRAAVGLALMRTVRRVRAFIMIHFFVEWVARRSSRVRRLRERFQALQPAVIISFLGATNIQTLLAVRGLGLPVLISERNDPAMQQLDPPWEKLRPRIYPEADVVTANSAGALNTMRRYVPTGKLHQVANPLSVPPCPSHISPGQNRFIAVARLVEQKGLDLLLDAFARIAASATGWELDIVGDGPLRRELEARVHRLAISEQVVFHGHQADPFPLLYSASVFVLPSRFEGMPNAMLEAMGCGLAVITSDASPGPLELVRDGETGLVVASEDSAALAAAMQRMILDPALRERLAAAARRAVQHMNADAVVAEWNGLIADTVANSRAALRR
jgi:glycosyltransferase involved in cell wall biosynthesis